MKALYKLFAFVAIAFYLFAPTTIVFAQTTAPALTATPTSGAAPLSVTFTSQDATQVGITGAGYSIDFGDGSNTAVTCGSIQNMATSCTGPVTLQHTYAAAGTYTATLKYSTTAPNATPNVLGTVTVTVGSGTTSSSTSCKLMLSTSSVTVGTGVTLSWTSINATGGAIVGVGNVGPWGSTTVHPSQNTTYVGSFTGAGGTANCSVTIQVTSTATGGTSYGVQNATVGSTDSSASTQTSSSGSGSNTSSNNTGFLVPCGYGVFSNATYALGNPTDQGSTGCQACSLAQLVQNIINFIIGLSIPVAAALFAWAGVLYFTSAENISQRQKAKDIFKNAFIGFVIIITAWLVINTLLNVIFSQSSVFKGGNWFKIECSASRPISGSIGTILSQALGTAQQITVDTSLNGSSGPTGNTSGLNLNNLSQADRNTINEAVSNSCVNSGQTDVASCTADATNNTILTQGAKDILVADCNANPNGDSCQALNDASAAATANSLTTAGIAAAASSYTGASTSAGPDGGNLACAWAVNNVLQSDGIAAIDGNSVPAMETALENGRGTLVNQSDAQAGDIVIEGNDGHVGICQNAGCSSVISNSSSNATFTWVSNVNFGSSYTSRIYQVNK